MIPEISVQELAEYLASEADFILLDVRETWEVSLAAIYDRRLHVAPLSRLASAGAAALPEAARQPTARIYVLCHHGIRSAQVTQWLRANGWEQVFSVRGGIDAWAREIDPAAGFY